MIRFQLDGKNLWVTIESDTNSARELHFKRECATELEAELLYRSLDKRLDTKIQAVRKFEYDAGWSDHRKHMPKRNFFYINILKTDY